MSDRSIDFVFFDGCPNADDARRNLREALQSAGGDVGWTEWDLQANSTPQHLRRYGSPTILIDGRDITGEGPGNAAMACRSDGVPAVASILEKLR